MCYKQSVKEKLVKGLKLHVASVGGEKMAFTEHAESQKSYRDEIKAQATFSRSAGDTRDLILVKVYSGNKERITYHKRQVKERD